MSEEISEKQKIASVLKTRLTKLEWVTGRLQNTRPFCSSASRIWQTSIPCTSTLSRGSSICTCIPSLTARLAMTYRSAIANILDHFTMRVYYNVCRSLFEKDKLLFSLLLTVGIMQGKGQVDDLVWRFLLTGGVALENPHPNPAPQWLSDKSWSEVVRASQLPCLEGLFEHVQENIAQWKQIYDSGHPQVEELPWEVARSSGHGAHGGAALLQTG